MATNLMVMTIERGGDVQNNTVQQLIIILPTNRLLGGVATITWQSGNMYNQHNKYEHHLIGKCIGMEQWPSHTSESY